jgi:hypothetical protein
VTGNYALDAGWDIEDASALPAGYDTGTWSNNTFACDSTGEGFFMMSAPWRFAVGGTCGWIAGYGCSGPVCSTGQYSGVTVQNNTITGSVASLVNSSRIGATLISNSFANGAFSPRGRDNDFPDTARVSSDRGFLYIAPERYSSHDW